MSLSLAGRPAPHPGTVRQVSGSPYVCPACLGSLRGLDSSGGRTGLTCLTCNEIYPIIDNIPLLIPEHSYNAFPLRHVQAIYNRAYTHDDLMGTQFDPDYARATKTILFDLCRSAPNTRILDIGTGDGQLWQFAPDAADWYAIDISHTGVRRAINRFPKLSGAVASCERLPFPERFFGAVIAADTLEHTFDLQQSLASIRRVLADDGIFCFSVPAPNSLRKWGYNKLLRGSPSPAFLLKLLLVVLRRTVLFGRPDFQPIDRDLSLREWRTLIEGAGFQIVQTRLWPSAPYTPIVRLVAARTVA